jgi:serine/threonine-protein kinase RIO1
VSASERPAPDPATAPADRAAAPADLGPGPTRAPAGPTPAGRGPAGPGEADQGPDGGNPAVGLAVGADGRAGGPAPTLPRLRRPSGDPPPLPRSWNRRNVALVVGLALWLFAWVIAYLPEESPPRRVDAALIDLLARDHRTPFTAALARAVDIVDRPTVLNWLALATVAGAAALGRFRRAVVQLGAILLTLWVAGQLATLLDEPRPYDVERLGRWSGYGMPSVSTAYLAVVLVGAGYCFLRPGRGRGAALAGTGGLVLLLAAAKTVLATNPPLAVLAGGGLGVLVAVAGFAFLVPEDVFPLTGRRTRSAHLDLDVRRPAIAEALASQVGLRLRELEPFGLAGSGGSSPMRLVVDGHPEPVTLFAKLYAQQHVRADRWYKLGRAMLYGRLEDERPFQTVRRMVQNEDYLLRVMRDAGLPVVRSYGFLELTPEREYVLVTEFATGAREICDEQVTMDLGLVDDGLRVVRGLWDAGIAHRDIKPSNLLVRDGRMMLIDVAFAELHPSPWRQAVDLANMMLVLALRTDAETVYRRALRFFSPDDLAEAFASCGGVTLPTQLRTMLAADGRDLTGRFRQLAPPRPPVRVQKWSPRRVGLLAGGTVAALLTAALVAGTLLTANPAEVRPPVCRTSTPVQLFGQAVPGAAYVPCVPRVYSDNVQASSVRNGTAVTYSSVPDGGVVTATYTGGCPPAGAEVTAPTLPLGTRAWAAGTGRVLLTFPGGCLRLDYPEDSMGRAELALPQLLDAVRLVPRWRLNAYVLRLTEGRERHL